MSDCNSGRLWRDGGDGAIAIVVVAVPVPMVEVVCGECSGGGDNGSGGDGVVV